MSSSSSSDSLADTAPRVTTEGLQRGQLVGRYVVLELVGSGAMGSVYAAYDPQLDRRVALKLVAGLSGDARAVERLLHEARSLAKLSHPSVVQVFDAGNVDGRVFLAMEFIEGESLADFARAEHPLDDRLAVLRAAGRGLAAAHAAGIVHRDFKPANVMVGRDGRTRVVDFGLARGTRVVSRRDVDSGSLRAAAMLDATTLPDASLPDGLAGTPRYMSPEQFRGEPADARSDQFSFCVTAWELCFGRFPFEGADFEALRSAVLQGRRASAPSGVLPTPAVAALVRGLSLEPRDRFPSMDDLLTAMLPAAPARRRSLGLVAGLSLLLGGGLLVGVRGSQCAAEGREVRARFSPRDEAALAVAFEATRLPYAKDAAALAAQALTRWTATLADTTAVVCRAERLVGPLSQLDLERRACLEASTRQLTVLLDAFHRADAAIVENAARAVGNLPDVARCATDRQALAHPSDRTLQGAASSVRARLSESVALADLGQVPGAARAADEALAQARGLSFAPLTAAASLQMARVRYDEARFAEADAAAVESVGLALGAHADELALEAVVVAARVAAKRDARADMDRWLRLAQALGVRLGQPPGLTARVLEAEGLVARAQSRFEEARRAFEQSRHLATEANLPAVVVAAATGEASALQRLGRCDEAEPLFRQAITTLEQLAGPMHVRLAPPLNNLALCVSVRAPDEARALYERALAISSAVGATSPLMSAPLLNIVEFELRRGDVVRAEQYLVRARAAVTGLGARHVMGAFLLGLEGKVKFARGAHPDAERDFAAGLELVEALRGAGSPDTADFLLGLGLCAEAAGRDAEATQRLSLALERLDQATVTPFSRVEALLGLARLAARQGKPLEADRFQSEAEALLPRLGALGARLRPPAGP
ncbi:MAG: serine/threonine-protein kinase [Myxococcaceae bacterium]|nr:serine/threonine-protein kinase [Myxococcaceae bacterium]